jgi:hypothetical protein
MERNIVQPNVLSPEERTPKRNGIDRLITPVRRLLAFAGIKMLIFTEEELSTLLKAKCTI